MISTIHGVLLETSNDRMIYGPVPEYSPFQNLDAFLYLEQWEPYRDKNIWWIGGGEFIPEYWGYDAEYMFELTYQNVDFSIWRVTYFEQ